jgi:hypothetical protein
MISIEQRHIHFCVDSICLAALSQGNASSPPCHQAQICCTQPTFSGERKGAKKKKGREEEKVGNEYPRGLCTWSPVRRHDELQLLTLKDISELSIAINYLQVLLVVYLQIWVLQACKSLFPGLVCKSDIHGATGWVLYTLQLQIRD